MAEWRQRGYVPDSDDEDEIAQIRPENSNEGTLANDSRFYDQINEISEVDDKHSQQTTVNHASTSENGPVKNSVTSDETSPVLDRQIPDGIEPVAPELESAAPVSPTARELEAQLNHGLTTIREVLRSTTPVQVDDDNNSALSSPLSSLPPSISASPRRLDEETFSVRSNPGYEEHEPSLHGLNLVDVADNLIPRRALRNRNPIQIHPYLIDFAKHQQEFKARGLRPVPGPQRLPEHVSNQKDETQNTSTFDGTVLDSSSNQPFDEPEYRSSFDGQYIADVAADNVPRFPAEFESDEELPDISDVLQGRYQISSIANLSKERSTARADKNRHRKYRPRLWIPKLPQANNTRIDDDQSEDAIFELPLSPPQSSIVLSPVTTGFSKNDKTSLIRTPKPLLTPIVSSDRASQKRPIIEVSSSPEEIIEEMNHSDSSDRSTSSSDKDDSQGVVQIRRKIKGVLPASWLKLDALKQKKVNDNKRAVQPKLHEIGEKGIAQRKRTSTSLNQRRVSYHQDASQMNLELEHSSSDSDPLSKSPFTMVNRSKPPTNIETFLEDDVMEEDTIDYMLPQRSRLPMNTVSSRKYQGRSEHIGKSFNQNGVLPTSTDSLRGISHSRNPAVQKSSKRTSRKRRKRKHDVMKLTVAHAPGLQSTSSVGQPRFLKIAVRSQKHAPTLQAQDPSQKFLQLATKEDTKDVNHELIPWQKRQRQNPRQFQSKLQPRSKAHARVASLPKHYQQGTYKSHKTKSDNITHGRTNSDLDSLKQSTLATLNNLQRDKLQTIGTEISTSKEIKSIEATPVTEGRYSLHMNRAGEGKFWTKTLSRQAQVEGIRISRHLAIEPLSNTPAGVTVIATTTPRLQATRCTGIVTSLEETLTNPRHHKRKQSPHRIVDQTDNSNVDGIAADETTTRQPEQLMRTRDTVLGRRYLTNLAMQIRPVSINIGNGTVLEHSAVSGRKLFFQSLKRFINGQTLPPSDFWSVTSLSAPLSGSTMDCTWLSLSMTGFIAQILDETWQILSADGATQKSSGKPANDVNKEKGMFRCIDDLLLWISQVPLQQLVKPPNLGVLLESLLSSLTVFVQRLTIARQNHAQSNSHQLLRVVHRLLMFATQLATIYGAAECCVDDTGHTRAMELVTVLAETAVMFSLCPDSIGEVLQELAKLSEWKNSSIFDSVIERCPEVETLYCVCMLWSIRRQPHALDDYLYCCITEHGGTRSDQKLAYTLLVIQSLHLMLGYACQSQSEPWTHASWAPWKIITPHLNSFLDDYTRAGGPFMKSSREFGLAVYRYCLSCVTTWRWSVSESVLNTMFKTYAEHDMIELFTQPTTNRDCIFNEQAYDLEQPRYSDTDYDIFLKMTALKLIELQKELANTAISDQNTAARNFQRDLRSLVSRLSPNNSRALNEEDSLAEQDLIAMGNTYKLYQVLYTVAPPGYQPRLSQIENLTNFSCCHEAVRKLTIDTWYLMTRHAIATNGFERDITELGTWINRMITSLLDKLRLMRAEIPTEPAELIAKQGEIEILVSKNQQSITSQLLSLINVWHQTLRMSMQPDVVRRLLGLQSFGMLFKLLKDEQIEDIVLVNTFRLVESYLQANPYVVGTSDGSIQSCIQTGMSQLLRDRMTSNHLQSRALQRAMIETWFSHATQHVKAKSRSWDTYLTSPANLSFPILADTARSAECSILFLSFVISQDENYLELDRETIYNSLLKGLLQPKETMMFEYDLVVRLMELDSATLAIGQLKTSIFAGVKDNEQGQARLVERRFEIVQHLIQQIWYLQFDRSDDSQDFIEPDFSSVQGISLLRTITTSLKATWYMLTGDDRLLWTSFAQATILQLQTHTYKGFVIDSWFTDKNQTEFPKPEHDLRQFFLHHKGTSRQNIDLTLIRLFREGCIGSLVSSVQKQWCKDTAQAILCNNPDFVQLPESLIVDVSLQVQVIQNVLAEYIERAYDSNINLLLSISVTTIVRFLYEALPHQIYLDETMEHYAHWIDISLVLLDSIRRVMQSKDTTNVDEQAYRVLQTNLVSTMCTILRGCNNLLDFLSSSGVSHPHEDDIPQLALIVWRLINDPDPDSWFHMADHPFQPLLSEEDDLPIRNAVAADLARSVAADWRQISPSSVHQRPGLQATPTAWMVWLDGVEKKYEMPHYVANDVHDDFSEVKRELEMVLEEMEVLEPEEDMLVGLYGDAGAMPDPLSL